MLAPTPDLAALRALLPEERVGRVEHIEPLTMGMSGAGVHAVTTTRGAYVVRIQGRDVVDGAFAQQLRVLRRAAEAGIAPAIVHVDEGAHAVVSERVKGVPLFIALADPAQRGRVLMAVVDLQRTLHGLDPSGVAERDPIPHARATLEANRSRPGFPSWATDLGPTFDAIAASLAGDTRRVVCHNDFNPGNVLWDGSRPWLVDWEHTGLGHPYYDLAALALFLRLSDEVALDLVARHDGTPLDERSRESFRTLRQLVGLFCGVVFLSLADDLTVRPAPARADAPTLLAVYEAIRSGQLQLQSSRGQASMGLAMLAESVGP